MHAKVHLLIGRSCCLPRCNSLDDKIKLNGMHRSIVHILFSSDANICTSPYIIIGAVLTDATLQMQGYYIMSHEIL